MFLGVSLDYYTSAGSSFLTKSTLLTSYKLNIDSVEATNSKKVFPVSSLKMTKFCPKFQNYAFFGEYCI
jgi:hypothetical protein